jgi:hypothetical protein
MVNQARTSRTTDTRSQSVRQAAWESPSVLPDPLPREGFVHRWVRLSAAGQIDPTNMNARMREGWVPVVATEYPEIQNIIPEEGRFSDNIVIGGLILCRAPIDRMQARDEAHKRLAASQIEAVDNNFLRESDPRMPVLRPERTSRVTMGPRNQDSKD